MEITKLSQNDRCLLKSVVQAINRLKVGVSIETDSISPALPYTIASGVFNSYMVVVTSGTVDINGATVPAGTYSFAGGVYDLLNGLLIEDNTSGVVTILTQKVV